MAETSFGVSYEGPALADGRMAVRDLAPALFALGELFTEASTTLYPDRPPVALDIHATKQGSFDVGLILTAAEGAWDTTTQLFGGDGVSALVNLKEIVLGGGTIGLLELIKILRGRTIQSEEPSVEPGMVTVTVDENTSVELPEDVLKLHKRVTIRRSARDVVKPVTREGINEFRAASESEITVTVGKDDLPAFEAVDAPDEEEEELQDSERDTTVQIVAISWNEGNKWRFSEGAADSSFYATIEDTAFLDGIEKGSEAFRKGDLLECKLRTRQRKVGAKLDVEYQIVNVTKHIAATEQLNLGERDADSDGLGPVA